MYAIRTDHTMPEQFEGKPEEWTEIIENLGGRPLYAKGDGPDMYIYLDSEEDDWVLYNSTVRGPSAFLYSHGNSNGRNPPEKKWMIGGGDYGEDPAPTLEYACMQKYLKCDGEGKVSGTLWGKNTCKVCNGKGQCPPTAETSPSDTEVAQTRERLIEIIPSNTECARTQFNWRLRSEKKLRGATEVIQVPVNCKIKFALICVKCNGTGQVPGRLWGTKKCPACNGTGAMRDAQNYLLKWGEKVIDDQAVSFNSASRHTIILHKKTIDREFTYDCLCEFTLKIVDTMTDQRDGNTKENDALRPVRPRLHNEAVTLSLPPAGATVLGLLNAAEQEKSPRSTPRKRQCYEAIPHRRNLQQEHESSAHPPPVSLSV